MRTIWPLLLLTLTGCQTPSTTATQAGAVEPIPLFEPARLKDFGSSDAKWCTGKQLGTYEWVWKGEAGQDKVAEFYQKTMPQAQVSTTPQGDKVFTWTGPPGATLKEELVTVNVTKDGTFRITECVELSRRKSLQEVVGGFPADNDVGRGK